MVHTYHVELTHRMDEDAVAKLRKGVRLGRRLTRRARVSHMTWDAPEYPPRVPPVGYKGRQSHWVEIVLAEKRSR